MATIKEATITQGTAEIRKWTADFTDDLPSGITVSSGTAYHTPPSGAASTVTIETSTPDVTVRLDNPTATGVHYLEVVATYTNGEKSSVTISFQVTERPTAARAGMLDLIKSLRHYAGAGVNDYSIAGLSYWSDAQLQDVLDRYRMDFNEIEMYSVEWTVNGSAVYKEYRSPYGNLEGVASGTTIFNLSDAAGTNIGTSLWTADYMRGIVTFSSDTTGSSLYLSGRSYDLNAAAADVWRAKAADAAVMYDISTDGHSLKRSQYMQNCMQMARDYEGKSSPVTVTLYRGDTQ